MTTLGALVPYIAAGVLCGATLGALLVLVVERWVPPRRKNWHRGPHGERWWR